MTTRDDVLVDFTVSPRIIEVASPSAEMTMQDLVDTIRKIEDSFAHGISFPKLLNASGKEELGGGVKVGITVNLQNAQLSFEPRKTAIAIGQVTTGSGPPIQGPLGFTYTFVDSNANFVAAGVQRGSLVINFTDHSIADVIDVVSSTELKTRLLVNGNDNEWDINDDYHVFNVVQCNATGGNLVAEDINGDSISPVFPTSFVQVIRTASSSATLQEQADIQYSSFNGGVTVDFTSSNYGTDYPIGTPRLPVNNFVDALSIASSRGFTTFYIIGDADINLGLDYSGYRFVGESTNKSLFIIDSNATVTNAEFSNATVQGVLDGGNVLTDCLLKTLNFVDGVIERCILSQTVTLSGIENAHFLDCYAGVPGVDIPIINLGGSGSALAVRNYNGALTLTNKNGSETVAIDLSSGQITIDNSVTNGTIIMRGVGRWLNEDTYSGGANIINELLNPESIATHTCDALDDRTYDGVQFTDILTNLLSMATGKIVESSPGVFEFYAQDNLTVLFTLTKSGSQRTRS